jgi:hypothetical protein
VGTAQSRRRLTPVSTRTGSVLINGHGARSAPAPACICPNSAVVTERGSKVRPAAPRGVRARTCEVWPLNVGQVYTTLQGLEGDRTRGVRRDQ